MTADTEPTKARKPLTAEEKLQKLLSNKQALEKQIAALKGKQNAQDRRDDTRSKIVFAGAIIADMKLYPEGREKIVERVRRGVTKDRDRELLKRRGLWD